MSGLRPSKFLRRAKTGAQRGAVIVLVAILFGSGVLMGMVSLVVDSGQLLLEKTITQVSADNVAAALAHACSVNSAECTSTIASNSSLVTIARSSFAKHPSAILSVCGSAAAVTMRPNLSSCGSFSGIPRDCVAPSSDYPVYVRVYTGYTASTGGTPLFPLLNNLIHGTTSNPSIESCAQSAWGTLSKIPFPSFPMILSICTAIEPGIVNKGNAALATTDKIIEGFTGTQNGPTTSNCAGKKDQAGKSIPSAANFLGFEVMSRPASGYISIGDTMTENTTWNVSTATIYQNALNTMINAGTFTKYPVVVNTALASKVVVAFVNFKPLAYRYGTAYYPNTALVKATFPSTGSSCTYLCLVGAISNATSQTAGMLAPTGPTSYNLGVNTIVPLQ
jgi:hypothetical protein